MEDLQMGFAKMRKNNLNVLFICPYPVGESPSQRFRFEQYFDLLKISGFSVEVRSFLTLSAWRILYTRGNSGRKILAVLKGFTKRAILLMTIRQFDFVFIHREASPIGPPWFEWTIAKVFGMKIIYDFDDAIWLPNTSEENSVASKLKWHSKVAAICKWSYAISCGNKYLCDFAKQYNARVILNPTTIDTTALHNPVLYQNKTASEQLTIGWTGTHSTLKYIDLILPVIKSLERKFQNRIRFVVIADKKPDFELSTLCFIPWSKETEIPDLLQLDIGLMPLTDDIWAKGKCGFKALQYMALGIPSLASPIGVNSIIIDDRLNGFLCNSLQQWEENIEILIADGELRSRMGEKGRAKVMSHYSVDSNSSNFLSLFE